jgi:hypothetical protein
MSETKFIDGPYAAAIYSKKKIGVGKSGGGAFLFVTPRAGEELDDDIRYTVQLMKTAPELYAMLDKILELIHPDSSVYAEAEQLLAKARGEK